VLPSVQGGPESKERYETIVEILPNQTAHTDGPKVIEVSSKKNAPAAGHGYLGCLNVMAKENV